MKVYLVANTTFNTTLACAASEYQWTPDEDNDDYLINNAGNLSEFAGRMCYQSWGKPNPETATNEGYIDNIRKQEHYSVLEHGTVSLALVGVSRSFTHELVRHRHFSYSQLSQRFCKLGEDTDPIIPTLFAANEQAVEIIDDVWRTVSDAYERLAKLGLDQLYGEGVQGAENARKRAREAARCVLPNMTPTEIVVTGNHRAWLEFLKKRGTKFADAEIRQVAIKVFIELRDLEPNIYSHLDILQVPVRWGEDGQVVEYIKVIGEREKAVEEVA